MNRIDHNAPRARLARVAALVRKESRQVRRDSSSIAIGVVLPALLILLFGYGLSLDVRNVPVAVVAEDSSPTAAEMVAGFRLSPYFQVWEAWDMSRAVAAMADRRVDAIVRLRSDFSRQLARGQARVEVLALGVDANRARIILGYAQQAVDHFLIQRAAEGYPPAEGATIDVRERQWFNEANESHYFLVPGLIVLIMTLIGALLTALVMAREWEQGTLEALFVTPARVSEILLGKTVPYFGLGLVGLLLCILSARFLFDVPLRGSLAVLAGASMLYLLVSLGLGLLISAAVKNQFLASQIAVLITFLPALMLSGFLFDLRSLPVAVRAVTYIVPARYYVELLQTVFLAGNVWRVIGPDLAILAGIAALLLGLARVATRKRVG